MSVAFSQHNQLNNYKIIPLYPVFVNLNSLAKGRFFEIRNSHESISNLKLSDRWLIAR